MYFKLLQSCNYSSTCGHRINCNLVQSTKPVFQFTSFYIRLGFYATVVLVSNLLLRLLLQFIVFMQNLGQASLSSYINK